MQHPQSNSPQPAAHRVLSLLRRIAAAYATGILLMLGLLLESRRWGWVPTARQNDHLWMAVWVHAGLLILAWWLTRSVRRASDQGDVAARTRCRIALACMWPLLLVSAESLARIVAPPPRADEQLVIHHAVRGYTLRPSSRTERFGVVFQTNTLGLRTGESNQDAGCDSAGNVDVILVGDSVVFGWDVPWEQTLAPHLAAAADIDCVIACAVPGYSLAQSVNLYEEIHPRVSSRAVVVVVCLNDIVADHVRTKAHRLGYGDRFDPPFWAERSGLFRLLRAITVPAAPPDAGSRLMELELASVRRLCENPEDEQFAAGWDDALLALRRLAEDAAAAGAPFLVACTPYAFQVSAELGLTVQRELADRLRAENVAYLDLAPTFLESPDSADALFTDECHLTDRGAALAAEAIADRLHAGGAKPLQIPDG